MLAQLFEIFFSTILANFYPARLSNSINKSCPPCLFIPKSVLDFQNNSSILVYSGLLIYEFSKKKLPVCSFMNFQKKRLTARLFQSARLLRTSGYHGFFQSNQTFNFTTKVLSGLAALAFLLNGKKIIEAENGAAHNKGVRLINLERNERLQLNVFSKNVGTLMSDVSAFFDLMLFGA